MMIRECHAKIHGCLGPLWCGQRRASGQWMVAHQSLSRKSPGHGCRPKSCWFSHLQSTYLTISWNTLRGSSWIHQVPEGWWFSSVLDFHSTCIYIYKHIIIYKEHSDIFELPGFFATKVSGLQRLAALSGSSGNRPEFWGSGAGQLQSPRCCCCCCYLIFCRKSVFFYFDVFVSQQKLLGLVVSVSCWFPWFGNGPRNPLLKRDVSKLARSTCRMKAAKSSRFGSTKLGHRCR